jgi:hypothetical protein
MAKFLRAGRDLSGKTAARDHARLTARVVARGAPVAGHAMVPISPDIRDRRDARQSAAEPPRWETTPGHTLNAQCSGAVAAEG